MIIRLSQRLAKKLKVGQLSAVPPEDNPYADWSAHLFTADRTQYIILTNTHSLYSVVMYGKGIADDSRFIGRALDNIREFMEGDGQAFIFQRLIAPASGNVRFAKSLNRSVTGSMNDMIFHAKAWLTEVDMSDEAFRELVRVLEKAVQAGADSVGLEWEDRDLVVYLNFGDTGLGSVSIPRDLQEPVLGELIERANLTRKPKGRMQVNLIGNDYVVTVNEYDSFGESAFTLTLKKSK